MYSIGTAVWKLDDPGVLRAERQERQAAAAEAVRKKMTAALDKKLKELDKYTKLAALPDPQAALSDKYSKFDAATGVPTHDKDGNALEGKVRGADNRQQSGLAFVSPKPLVCANQVHHVANNMWLLYKCCTQHAGC